jgi:hypothetical protein
METTANRACPVCDYPATVTDWRPVARWLAVEDCPCGGFFLWKPLVDRRLPALRDGVRDDLATWIIPGRPDERRGGLGQHGRWPRDRAVDRVRRAANLSRAVHLDPPSLASAATLAPIDPEPSSSS